MYLGQILCDFPLYFEDLAEDTYVLTSFGEKMSENICFKCGTLIEGVPTPTCQGQIKLKSAWDAEMRKNGKSSPIPVIMNLHPCASVLNHSYHLCFHLV